VNRNVNGTNARTPPAIDADLRSRLVSIRRASIALTDAIEGLLLIGKYEPRERSLAPLGHDRREEA
jgi:hypothetical protein